MTSQNTPEDEITTDMLWDGAITESRFNRFDDELIDKYFNEEGKVAIEQYIQRKVTEARIDEFATVNGIWGEAESVSPKSAGVNIHDRLIKRQKELTESKTLKEREEQ